MGATTGGREAVIPTLSVATARSGDTSHIERIYLDRDQAYGSAQAYNGIRTTTVLRRWSRSRWRSGRAVPRRVRMTARIGGPSRWAGGRGCDLRHTRDGERRDDFDIRREWWTGDALPKPR